MNQKLFGTTIARLRKRSGMTQTVLARLLNVSDKAVSKWETGLGYPEITLLPKLAAVFGVTVDYLITGERKGITIVGDITTDVVKTVDQLPQIGKLANISSISRSGGGCAQNTAIDLAKIDSFVPVSVASCIGDDENGRYVLSQMHRCGIDTSRVQIVTDTPTSFTDVMTLPDGKSIFFHTRGANSLFDPEHLEVSALTCSILHVGYLMIMDRFRRPDPEYGTVLARFLKQVQSAGIGTSIDLMIPSVEECPAHVLSALPFCDYVIVLESGCSDIWYRNTPRETEAFRQAMEKIMARGVGKKVILCRKGGCFCLSADGSWTQSDSLPLPKDQIRGIVGFGDAFFAGCLYGICQHYSDADMLAFASAAAACSLLAENGVDGMRSRQDILRLRRTFVNECVT